jgi:glycosyltransferase involved in cell wall biosynthesis
VLYVGALSKTKNVRVLLESASLVIKDFPKTLFLIVGEGKEKEELLKLAKGLGGNVRFEGEIAHQEIGKYYHACDILVLPSLHEGWGRVVIESLGFGKPVIVSEACGVSELVANLGCGFIFPANRPDVLAEKICLLLKDPGLRKEMGKKGKRYVLNNLDIKKNAHMYRKLLEETL